MKIYSISPYKHSVYTAVDNSSKNREFSLPCTKATTQNMLHDFPKSYIKIHPSFGYGYTSLSLEEQREIDRQNQLQQDKNDYLWAKSWDPDKAKKEYEALAQKQINVREKEAFFYLKPSSKEAIRNDYEQQYKKQLKLYEKVMDNISYYRDLFRDDIKYRPRSVSEIMQNTKGELDSKIAGYSDLKRDMRAKFITPVTEEMLYGGEKEVANSILLCGPTGCGKTATANAIANETYCYVDRISTDTYVGNFAKVITEKIREARLRYYARQAAIQKFLKSAEYQDMTQQQKDEKLHQIGSPRTVVIIDEFDRYFNPLVCTPPVITQNRDAVKSLFDGCSKLPTADGDKNAAAVTFICTTNYPARIPLGDFNPKKVSVFGVFPPKGQDMQDVIRFYMAKANELIREYKRPNPNLEEIKPEEVNLEKFVKKFEPTLEKGAFSNDAISDIVMSAAESYIDNPHFDFNLYLLRGFKNSVRDIRPEKLKKYTEQMEKIHLKQEEPEAKIDASKMSEKEVIQKKIEKLTKYGEDFLMPDQLEELAQLREQLAQLENKN